ncbi:hypothetical protein ColTof4_04247 [Colletotrichum tofieldiae]|nr:hypothetical protein ColTof3_14094 [Colletotrichum tofieldiae]GKT71824.1 hypothetical protein ColTof4_04247 [Colletotrichum tofieldiae]
MNFFSVNLLHGAVAGLDGRRLSSGRAVGLLLLLIDVQAELNKLVDALSEAGGLVNGEARDEQGGLEQELDDGLDGAVILAVGLDLVLELLDDGALGGDLEGLLGRHVRGHGGVTEGLGLHDTLHVGGPTELAGADGAGGAGELVGDDNLLDLVAENVEDDLGAAAKGLTLGVGGDGEGATGGGLPDVLLVIVVLGDDGDLVGDKVGRVETNTELTDHGDIGTGGESLHELLGAGTGNGTKVVDEVLRGLVAERVGWGAEQRGATYSLGETNTSVTDGESLVLLVGDDVDSQVLARVELAGVGEGLIADLVQGIGGVGDKFTQEDLLV